MFLFERHPLFMAEGPGGIGGAAASGAPETPAPPAPSDPAPKAPKSTADGEEKRRGRNAPPAEPERPRTPQEAEAAQDETLRKIAEKAYGTGKPQEAPAEKQAPDRKRADDGKFVRADGKPSEKTEKAPSKEAPEAGSRSQQRAAEEPDDDGEDAPEVEAPKSFSAEERESFKKLDRAGQEFAKKHAERRDADIQRQLSEIAPKVQKADRFSRVHDMLEQHEGYLKERGREIGRHPVDMMDRLITFEKILARGDQGQKLAVMADIAQSYGVDLGHLLADYEADPSKYVQDERVAPLVQQVNDLNGKLEAAYRELQGYREAEDQQLERMINEFANGDGKEFYREVAPYMAGILQTVTGDFDLKTIYEQACHAHPQVRQVLARRASEAATRERQEQERVGEADAVEALNTRGLATRGTPGDIDSELRAIARKHGMRDR